MFDETTIGGMDGEFNPPSYSDMYEYVNKFTYSTWVPNSTVTLCNVPWDANYRDVVSWSNQEEVRQYFAGIDTSQTHTIGGMTTLREGYPIRIPVPFKEASQFNYLVATNPPQSISRFGEERYYYFVTSTRYVSNDVTEITVQLDVWTSFFTDVKFGYSYLERGHAAIANAMWRNNPKDYLCEPEGLQFGSEYEIVKQEFLPFLNHGSYIIITSSVNLLADYGNVDNPKLLTANASIIGGLPTGAQVLAIRYESFMSLMLKLTNAPWIAQNIQSLTVVPKDLIQVVGAIEANGITFYDFEAAPFPKLTYESSHIEGGFGFPPGTPEKLKMFPYAFLEITNLSGDVIILKPERLKTTSGTVKFTVETVMNSSEVTVKATPQNYGGIAPVSSAYGDIRNDARSVLIEAGENFDMSLTWGNFPKFAVPSDGYQMALAATAHSRAVSMESLDWAHNKTTRANQLSYDMSMADREAQQKLHSSSTAQRSAALGIAQDRNTYNGMSNLSTSLGVGAVSAAMGNVGGVLGAAGHAGFNMLNMSKQSDWLAQENAIAQSGANISHHVSQDLGDLKRDENRAYADYAARGDYQQAIAAQAARVEDAKITAPSMSGQVGADAFNYARGYFGILIKWKRINDHFTRRLTRFWNRFGYATNAWMVPPKNLRLANHYTYWKFTQADVIGNAPHEFINTVRGILEMGVTVYNDPDDIGKVNPLDNVVDRTFNYE